MSVECTRTEATPALITFALDSLRAEGVKRAHIFVGAEGGLLEAAMQAGFEPREGESLYQIQLSERPIIPNANLYPYVLRDGTADDLIRLGLRLAEIPELAFESWELPLLFSNIDKHDRFFKVIDLHGEIVGISVGGSSGPNGTISHTWVAKEHRGHGLGHALSDASLAALYDGGAQNIHLMTVAGNAKANLFWEHRGFVQATDVQFLEIDL
jgi:GNAT superfamily N-acetyltransferase